LRSERWPLSVLGEIQRYAGGRPAVHVAVVASGGRSVFTRTKTVRYACPCRRTAAAAATTAGVRENHSDGQ